MRYKHLFVPKAFICNYTKKSVTQDSVWYGIIIELYYYHQRWKT